MYYHKIIKGIDGSLIAPSGTATIEQAANIAVRLCNEKERFVSEKKDFSDYKLEWIVKPQFDGLVANTWFACGRAAVSKNGKYGYINSSGEVVVELIYDKAYAFYDGVAKVVKDGKTGYIDCDGAIVVPLAYDDGGECSENRIWLSKDGKFGFADKSGSIVVPLIYDYAYNFSGAMAPVKKDGLYGYIDKSGNSVIDFKFQWAGAFSEDLARICENGDFSYIDRSGTVVIDGKWDYAYDFHDGRANVYDHDRDAMIDTNGNYIVNYGSFRGMWRMSEGLTRVHHYSRYESMYGYVDQSGQLLFPLDRPFFDAEDFHEGLALVSTHSNVTDRVLRSFMTKTGELILPYREKIADEVENEDDFFYMCRFSEGMAAVITQEGKLGFVKNPLFD